MVFIGSTRSKRQHGVQKSWFLSVLSTGARTVSEPQHGRDAKVLCFIGFTQNELSVSQTAPPEFLEPEHDSGQILAFKQHLRVADSEVKAITINMIIVPYSKFHFALLYQADIRILYTHMNIVHSIVQPNPTHLPKLHRPFIVLIVLSSS